RRGSATSPRARFAAVHVAFRGRPYPPHARSKVMPLAPDEFIRRFLLHTLPDGFHRIRHYGFLANGHRAAKLALCGRLLEAPATDALVDEVEDKASLRASRLCPCCGGVLLLHPIAPPL